MPKMSDAKIGTVRRDSSDPYDQVDHIVPQLSDEQIERVKLFGTVEELKKGYEVFTYGVMATGRQIFLWF